MPSIVLNLRCQRCGCLLLKPDFDGLVDRIRKCSSCFRPHTEEGELIIARMENNPLRIGEAHDTRHSGIDMPEDRRRK